MKRYLTIVLSVLSLSLYGQELTGSQLLEKAIAYHDPNGAWPSFNGTLNVTMETPNNPNRDSHIWINLPEEYFFLKAKRDTVTTQYTLDRGKCIISLADSLRIANQKEKPRRSHCEMATLYKNYYTYLYGLPMKLKDPGGHIDPKTEYVTFKGKKYLRLKVTYDEAVGTDVWFFYFDPKTYAMEIYQFYKGDPKGEGKNTGEYILLTGEEIINGIKMPKTRAWYYNKDDKYLGTDILKSE